MFCMNCGNKLDERVKYCPYCGNEVSNDALVERVTEKRSSVPNYVHCPKCKSDKIISTTKTTTTGGRDIIGGFFGFLIFGAIGYVLSLFNGLVGVSAGLVGLFIFGFKKVKSQNHTQFNCQKCGFSFLPVEDMIAERKKTGLMGVVLGIAVSAGGLLGMDGLKSLGCAVFGLMIMLGAVISYSDKTLETDGYDAKDYLENNNKKK